MSNHSPPRPTNTSIDAPSAIIQSTTALDKVRGLFDSHAFKFREFVLNAKAPEDKGVATTSSAGLEVDPAITLSVVVEELVGYLELYPKLRFQYDELKTKENYIKDLLGIEDLQVDLHDSNYNFEPEKEYLKQCKEELGLLKTEMRSLLQEIESVSERVAKGWTENEKNITVLEKLPEELKELDEAIREEMKRVERSGDSGQGDGGEGSDEIMHLPLKEMEDLIRNLELEEATLDSEVSHLGSEILRRQRMMDKLDKELGPLEADREELVGRAEQEKEKREMERESGQDRNLHGRWNKAVLEAMGQLLPR